MRMLAESSCQSELQLIPLKQTIGMNRLSHRKEQATESAFNAGEIYGVELNNIEQQESAEWFEQ